MLVKKGSYIFQGNDFQIKPFIKSYPDYFFMKIMSKNIESGIFEKVVKEMKKLDKNNPLDDIEATADPDMSSPGGVPYLGSKISLISKSEIRYEGILYTLDTKDSTVALSKVRLFGTEDRPTDCPVTPREEIYEYIIFRGSEIKDIRICQPPKPQPTLESGLPNDPAIIQHSTSSNVSPMGSGSYGPIGSSSFSNSMPGPPFFSGNSSQPQSKSQILVP